MSSACGTVPEPSAASCVTQSARPPRAESMINSDRLPGAAPYVIQNSGYKHYLTLLLGIISSVSFRLGSIPCLLLRTTASGEDPRTFQKASEALCSLIEAHGPLVPWFTGTERISREGHQCNARAKFDNSKRPASLIPKFQPFGGAIQALCSYVLLLRAKVWSIAA